ncbi:MAG TPA: MBL fold metallo-hydrolase [Caldimonas sp.]
MANLVAAHEFDIRIRQLDERASAAGVVILAEDIAASVVYDEDELKVTAFEVDHAPVAPAFGYRIDYRDRSIVLSGDTRVCENLVRHAEGVDLLVDEVVSPESYARVGISAEAARTRIEHHTTAQQAGSVFAKTRPRPAVYSHIAPPSTTAPELIAATRATYSGALEVGEDLMVIEVGQAVEVRRPARTAP